MVAGLERIARFESDKSHGIEVILAGNDLMKERWNEIEATLRKVFKGADFADEFTSESPIIHTRAGIDGQLGPAIGHVLALGETGKVLGGLFCIPTRREKDETDCDVGWVFMVPGLDPKIRSRIVEEVMTKTFTSLKEAGFERIVTQMGTLAGVKSLSRRYGIIHTPTTEQQNRWVKEL